jgi:hypothetical protein
VRFSSADYNAMLVRRNAKNPAAPKSPAAERESELQDDIESECRRRGWLAFRSRMDRATTMPIGFPDFVIMAESGRTIWIEAKSRKGKVRPEQRALHSMAHHLGHEVFTVRSMSEFFEAVTLSKKTQIDPYEMQIEAAVKGGKG